MEDKLYGFIKEKNVDLPGIINTYRYSRESLAIVEVTEDVFHKLSAMMLDADIRKDSGNEYRKYMKEIKCNFLLLIWHENEEERLYFLSDSKKVRALEFLDYLLPEFGLVRGNARAAGGRISGAILNVKLSDKDLDDTMMYFLSMSASYFEDCDCIMASEYVEEVHEQIKLMKKYQKKKIPWAVVKSTDVVPKGESFHIKSLENESGLRIVASDEVYIMIGCRGEIYDIEKEKFDKTYELTEDRLDIFEQMLEFLPEVERDEDGEFVSIDELAYLCYPKQGKGIYAKEIKNRTKIFPVSREHEYYLGRPGDYLAVRIDDIRDVYIIQADIFKQTYELKQEKDC